jgi:serine/threonine-protein kinase
MAFEKAWRSGSQPAIEDYLRGAGAERVPLLRELVLVDLERRLKGGEGARVEEYLQRFAVLADEPDSVLDLIALEYEQRRRQEAAATVRADILGRFPEHRQALAARLPDEEAAATFIVQAANRAPAAPVATPQREIQVAWAAARGPQFAGEIQDLLRKRLRLMGFMGSGLYGCFTVTSALPIFRDGAFFVENWFYYPIFWSAFVVFAAMTGLLWRARSLSIGQLRAIETIIFCVALADPAWALFCDFFVTRGLVVFVGLAPSPDFLNGFMLLLGGYWSLRFFVLIVGYSTLIPCSWRRCTLMVGAAGITPLLIGGAGIFRGGVDLGAYLQWFLLPMGLFLAVAAIISVYGSHRISVLRRQAFEARQLGQYQLKGRLGSGGMGEVYLAEHLLLRRPCAIKLIRPDQVGDPKNLVRFEREVQATATLTHPNTVQLFDYGHAEDGTFYYVMEYLPGLTLEQLVKEHGPLPPARAVHFLRQVCGALEEAHAIGLIHRDLKPGNVMVCQRGGVHDVAKLLDFGLVLPQGVDPDGERLTQEGAIAGTPAYMSPEQASGRENLDARSDIYSVGGLAYFLLAGQSPFAGRSAVRMLAAHMYEPPAPLTNRWPEVTEELEAIVLRCLAKDPAERFASAATLKKALAGCPAAGRWTEEEAACWWRASLRWVGECACNG